MQWRVGNEMSSTILMLVAGDAIGIFFAIICLAIGFGSRPSRALQLLGLGFLASSLATLLRVAQRALRSRRSSFVCGQGGRS